MSRWLPACLVAASTLFLAPAANAQEPRKFGVVMGLTPSVGVRWQVHPRVVLRPEVAGSLTTNEYTGPIGNPAVGTIDNASISAGASVLIFVAQWDALRAYVSPRIMYTRQSLTSTVTGNSSSGSTYATTGSFGAEYTLGSRFGIFGEMGVNYSRASQDSGSTTVIESRARAVSIRSGAGIVVYF